MTTIRETQKIVVNSIVALSDGNSLSTVHREPISTSTWRYATSKSTLYAKL